MLKQKIVLFGLALGALIVTGCAVTQQAVSEDEMGLRQTSLYAEDKTTADATNYAKTAPGESKVFARSFENVPPMIPHDVEGMLDITKEMNMCMDCHMPAMAEAVAATPVPASHLASFRPLTQYVGGEFKKDGKPVANTSDIIVVVHEREGLSMDRYTCTACHAPQSDNALIVANRFTSVFRSEEGGATSSNLLDVLKDGI